jgi:hypothetical protein
MKKLLILPAIMLLAATVTFAQSSKKRTNAKKSLNIKLMNSDKLPDGVYVKGSKLYAKKGYKFITNKEKEIFLMQVSGGNVMGKFWCYCNSDQGGCRTLTYTNHIECNPNDEIPKCEVCELRVLIGDDFRPKVTTPIGN